MTTNENDQNPHLSPLMANILTANAAWSESIHNQVLDNNDREIREWKSAFAKLYDAIDIANKSVDSLRIERILGTFATKRDFSDTGVDTY